MPQPTDFVALRVTSLPPLPELQNVRKASCRIVVGLLHSPISYYRDKSRSRFSRHANRLRDIRPKRSTAFHVRNKFSDGSASSSLSSSVSYAYPSDTPLYLHLVNRIKKRVSPCELFLLNTVENVYRHNSDCYSQSIKGTVLRRFE